ncbi:hypothetical protein GCM10009757_50510 [Streptomyces cheonanensis]|uniref:Uncharacterized protein n=1 Tax=Streptomyces cheonanensis TaxID=312720 RepID=A0ABN2VL01_9ACTN
MVTLADKGPLRCENVWNQTGARDVRVVMVRALRSATVSFAAINLTSLVSPVRDPRVARP